MVRGEGGEKDWGRMNRCYLTGAVSPAWCVGSRYDRAFAYALQANAAHFSTCQDCNLMVRYKSLGCGVGGLVLSVFHTVDVTWSNQQECLDVNGAWSALWEQREAHSQAVLCYTHFTIGFTVYEGALCNATCKDMTHMTETAKRWCVWRSQQHCETLFTFYSRLNCWVEQLSAPVCVII